VHIGKFFMLLFIVDHLHLLLF